ncbi:MAG: M56 family metallopeptidase, partial [Nonlabens sp.]
AHEIIHVKQFHSWDLMAYEVYKIVFWFHPICYIAQRELKQVHEYIVDHVLTKNQESISYQESLLKTVFGAEQFSLTSSYFNKSLLKNRILMLQKKKSTTKALFKLAFIIPIVLGSLIFTACNQESEFMEETIVLDDSNNYGIVKRSEFKAGLKDYYLNISKEDKKFIEEIVGKNSFEIKEEDTIKIKKIVNFFPILRKNGTTIILDDIENTGIISAYESPFDKDVRFDGFPLEHHLNMTKKEYANFVKYVSINYPNTTHSYTDAYNDGVEAVDFNIPFSKLDEVPHFEDCTGTQVEIKKCTQQKISFIVNKNFNTDIAKDLPGRHKIAVQFKIDKNGKVTGVQSKAKSTELQNEAARVINLLPKMIPGKQDGKEVGVIYALPIIFETTE